MSQRYLALIRISPFLKLAVTLAVCLFTQATFAAAPQDQCANPNTAALCTLNQMGPVTTDNVTSGDSNKILVSAGTKDKNADINIALGKPTDGSVTNLKISAPLGSNNESQFATLDGFTNSYSATFNIKRLTSTVFEECTAVRQVAFNELSTRDKDTQDLADIKKNHMNADNCNQSDIDDIMRDPVFKEADLAAFAKDSGYDDFIKDENQTKKLYWLYGSTLTFGTNQYKYVNLTTATQLQETKSSWGITAYGGAIVVGTATFLLSYSHQLTPKEGTTTTVCDPQSLGTPFKCVAGPLGAPQLTDKNILALGMRMKFTSFAISPSISHDYVAKANGIDFPIYLVPDSSSATKYTGGIRFGWRSDSHDFTAVIFVGTDFDYYGSAQ